MTHFPHKDRDFKAVNAFANGSTQSSTSGPTNNSSCLLCCIASDISLIPPAAIHIAIDHVKCFSQHVLFSSSHLQYIRGGGGGGGGVVEEVMSTDCSE